MAFCLMISLMGDIGMLIFMRNRQSSDSRLSTSSDPNVTSRKYNMTVPVHATMLSLISLAFFAIIAYYGIYRIGKTKSTMPWIIMSISQMWNGLVVPFMVFKIFKSRKNRGNDAQCLVFQCWRHRLRCNKNINEVSENDSDYDLEDNDDDENVQKRKISTCIQLNADQSQTLQESLEIVQEENSQNCTSAMLASPLYEDNRKRSAINLLHLTDQVLENHD